ncbi:hypothetical protein GOODEAATRI_007155 [Goodea atripinnis]|uniref:Uncharacterized protein n=1 Tax=Goodea atripinnis TaxID=208336 RepID=A0ABV0MR65_9TELE
MRPNENCFLVNKNLIFLSKTNLALHLPAVRQQNIWNNFGHKLVNVLRISMFFFATKSYLSSLANSHSRSCSRRHRMEPTSRAERNNNLLCFTAYTHCIMIICVLFDTTNHKTYGSPVGFQYMDLT